MSAILFSMHAQGRQSPSLHAVFHDIDALDLIPYRSTTIRLLRRYMKLALETGRLPSVLGNLHFRQHLTPYPLHTFEDTVIFVHDMEQCVKKLDLFSQQVLARCVLQEYPAEDAAALLGCGLRTVERRLPESLDDLSLILLKVGLLKWFPAIRKPCQGESNIHSSASSQKHGK